MNLLRKHWFDIGGLLAIVSLIYIYISYPHQSSLHTILWLSFVSLFIHQLEEKLSRLFSRHGQFGYV